MSIFIFPTTTVRPRVRPPGFINIIKPEVSIASTGLHNTKQQPSPAFLNNVNGAARATLVYCTTGGDDNDGYGYRGFVNSEGTVAVESDGSYYQIATAAGGSVLCVCDELAAQHAGPSPGDLRLSEYHSRPHAVPGNAGEWFEIMNVSAYQQNLAGMRVSQNNDTSDLMVFATPILLKPGAVFTFNNDGDRQRNGGCRADACEPSGAITLSGGADSLRLRYNNSIIDEVAWGAGWPGVEGVAVQRKDLFAANIVSNWTNATVPYGAGDLGTPGKRNTANITFFQRVMAPVGSPQVGQPWAVNFASLGQPDYIFAAALSPSIAGPYFNLLGQNYPLNDDPLVYESILYPGFINFFDGDGFATTTLLVPNDPALHGFNCYGAFATFAWPSIAPSGASGPVAIGVP